MREFICVAPPRKAAQKVDKVWHAPVNFSPSALGVNEKCFETEY